MGEKGARKMRNLTMIELYCSYPTRGGIFSFMNLPAWQEWDIDNKMADRLYFTKHGLRRPAYCLEQYNELGYLDEKTRKFFSELLEFEFKLKWKKLFDTMKFEYDPISNYDMQEIEDISGSNEGSHNHHSDITNTLDSNSNSGYTLKRSGEDISEIENSRKLNTTKMDKDGVFGWDSSEVSQKSLTDSESNDDETIHSVTTNKPDLTDTNSANNKINSTDSTLSNSDTTTRGEHDSHRVLTRKGNIGVTLAQRMVEAERDLWLWNYFDIIFNDVNKVLTLSVY